MDISGLNHAAVLAALYNGSKPLGAGFIQYNPTPMTEAEAESLLGQGYFDYLKGRVMKIKISPDSDEVDTWGYNRDNGINAAENIIAELRKRPSDVNPESVELQHLENTRNSAMRVKEHLFDQNTIGHTGNMIIYRMGISDLADYIGPVIDTILDDEDKTEQE